MESPEYCCLLQAKTAGHPWATVALFFGVLPIGSCAFAEALSTSTPTQRSSSATVPVTGSSTAVMSVAAAPRETTPGAFQWFPYTDANFLENKAAPVPDYEVRYCAGVLAKIGALVTLLRRVPSPVLPNPVVLSRHLFDVTQDTHVVKAMCDERSVSRYTVVKMLLSKKEGLALPIVATILEFHLIGCDVRVGFCHPG